jgi:hypothetical protein
VFVHHCSRQVTKSFIPWILHSFKKIRNYEFNCVCGGGGVVNKGDKDGNKENKNAKIRLKKKANEN